jgi:hypothetical protein
LLRKFFFSSLFAFIAVAGVAMAPASAALPVPAPVHTEKIDDIKAVAPMALRCEVKQRAAVVVNTRTGETRSPDRTGKLVAVFAASYPNSRPFKVPWC